MIGRVGVSGPAELRGSARAPATARPARTDGHRRAATDRAPWAPYRVGRSAWIAALLLALFVAAIAIVDPRGEFPLNDDWSFAASARRLFFSGDWRPLGWASMTQVTQALVGTLVCAASSCSHEHLRAGTLAVGAILIASTFALLRAGGGSRLLSALGAMATTFNPVIYPLFYTFMTDAVFQLTTVLAALACVVALRSGRWRHVAAAAALIGVATLSRQLGIALAMAFLPISWSSSEGPRVGRAAKAAAPLAFCTAILLAYETWMRRTGRMPALYDAKYAELATALSRPLTAAFDGVANGVISSLYLGLFCLPVLLQPNAPGLAIRGGPAVRLAWGWTAAAALLMLKLGTMPLLGNVLNKSGNGPLTLRDVYVLRLPDVPQLPSAFWVSVSGLGLLGSWLLARELIALGLDARKQIGRGRITHPLAVRLFAVLAAALYLLPLLPQGPFDRYLAVIAPVLCLGLLRGEPRPGPAPLSARAVAACAYAAALAAVSVAAAHDYLSWNRARWQAIAEVEGGREADARTLDGGFEYNGARSYDPGYAEIPGKSWWWVSDDALQLSFAPIPGTTVVRRYPYVTYLPPASRSIALLRRVSP